MNAKSFVRSALFVLFILFLAGCGGPVVISDYGSYKIAGRDRIGGRAHPGVDVSDIYGAPVLAAADGEVAYVVRDNPVVGNCVLLAHTVERDEKGLKTRYTLYCHLAQIQAKMFEAVKRGQQIGTVGTSSGVVNAPPHVHWELCASLCPYGHYDGDFRGTEDPLAITVGCFDPGMTHPTDRLVLTYPVRCKSKK